MELHKKKIEEIQNIIDSNKFLISPYFQYYIINHTFNINFNLSDIKIKLTENILKINNNYFQIYNFSNTFFLKYIMNYINRNITNKIEKIYDLPELSVSLNKVIIIDTNNENNEKIINIENFLSNTNKNNLNEQQKKYNISIKNIINFNKIKNDNMITIAYPLNEFKNQILKFKLMPNKNIQLQKNDALLFFSKLDFDIKNQNGFVIFFEFIF